MSKSDHEPRKLFHAVCNLANAADQLSRVSATFLPAAESERLIEFSVVCTSAAHRIKAGQDALDDPGLLQQALGAMARAQMGLDRANYAGRIAPEDHLLWEAVAAAQQALIKLFAIA